MLLIHLQITHFEIDRAQSGPWQQNFVDARFLQFHMFSAVLNTTTIGLLEFYIRVRLKVTYVWRKIQEAQSNNLLRTARLFMRLDASAWKQRKRR